MHRRGEKKKLHQIGRRTQFHRIGKRTQHKYPRSIIFYPFAVARSAGSAGLHNTASTPSLRTSVLLSPSLHVPGPFQAKPEQKKRNATNSRGWVNVWCRTKNQNVPRVRKDKHARFFFNATRCHAMPCKVNCHASTPPSVRSDRRRFRDEKIEERKEKGEERRREERRGGRGRRKPTRKAVTPHASTTPSTSPSTHPFHSLLTLLPHPPLPLPPSNPPLLTPSNPSTQRHQTKEREREITPPSPTPPTPS